jgi:hypothetical protein
MQYQISTANQQPDVPTIEKALQGVDAAAWIDLDQRAAQLRISTYLSGPELIAVFDGSGYPISIDRLVRVPSECCGGCGG